MLHEVKATLKQVDATPQRHKSTLKEVFATLQRVFAMLQKAFATLQRPRLKHCRRTDSKEDGLCNAAKSLCNAAKGPCNTAKGQINLAGRRSRIATGKSKIDSGANSAAKGRCRVDSSSSRFEMGRCNGELQDEVEANRFAAELLMPRQLLEKELAFVALNDLLDDRGMQKLAKRFQVSVQAMSNRLASLGYIAQSELG